MESTHFQPYFKVFFDTMDRLQVIRVIEPGRTAHFSIATVGDGLFDFAALDLTEYKQKISEATGDELVTPEKHLFDYDTTRNLVFDIAELLKDAHFYAFFFLVGTLNSIVLSPIYSLDDEETKWAQLAACFDTLRGVAELHAFCNDAIQLCLDVDTAASHTMAERTVALFHKYPDLNEFILNKAYAIMPTENGRLDFERVAKINRGEEKATPELLADIHGEEKGVSLLPYYRVESLEYMLLFELMEVLRRGYPAKRCAVCGRFFVLRDKRARLYCDRVFAEGRTCREIGGKRAWKNQLVEDEHLQQYKRIYERMASRYYRAAGKLPKDIKGKDMSREDFEVWSGKAAAWRRDYLAGRISGEEMVRRLEDAP